MNVPGREGSLATWKRKAPLSQDSQPPRDGAHPHPPPPLQGPPAGNTGAPMEGHREVCTASHHRGRRGVGEQRRWREARMEPARAGGAAVEGVRGSRGSRSEGAYRTVSYRIVGVVCACMLCVASRWRLICENPSKTVWLVSCFSMNVLLCTLCARVLPPGMTWHVLFLLA